MSPQQGDIAPSLEGKSPRKGPCCRPESCCCPKEHKVTGGCGGSRDKTKNPGGKQSGSGWGRGQDSVWSDISYLWLFVSPYLLSPKEGRGFVLRGRLSPPKGSRAPVTGTTSLGWSWTTMTLCRDGNGSLGCWNRDSLLSHPAFP